MSDELKPCADCGMYVYAGEYHPYAACLMFKACHDSATVRTNLSAIRESRPTPEQSREARDARNIESYRIWAISEGVTTTTLGYKIWRAAIDAAMGRSALGREGSDADQA